MGKKKLVLIDGHAVLFRAYYAFPHLTGPGGELVNAVYGFTLILLNVIAELEPTHILVTFDRSEPTFRHEQYEEYKATRQETPQELIDQEPKVREVIDALNIPIFSLAGYEADDLIGTLAKLACEKKDVSAITQETEDIEVIIVTGDKDLLQLVDDRCKIRVYLPGRGQKPSLVYDEAKVIENMGIKAKQVPDYKGFAGDSSDNIPGVKGIGPKTAVGLLVKYSCVEQVYEKIGTLLAKYEEGKAISDKQPDYKKQAEELGVGKAVFSRLVNGKEMALKSKELATIAQDAPIELDLEACKVHGYDKGKAVAVLESLGFKSLIRRLPDDDFEIEVQEALF